MTTVKSILQHLLRAFFGAPKDGFTYPDHHALASDLYETTAPYSVAVSLIGYDVLIEVGAGYLFDGATIPRWLWPLAGAPMEPPHDAAALIHDWLYACQILPKRQADWIYAQVLAQAGYAYWRVAAEWLSVLLFGDPAWQAAAKLDTQAAANKGRIIYLPPTTNNHNERKNK